MALLLPQCSTRSEPRKAPTKRPTLMRDATHEACSRLSGSGEPGAVSWARYGEDQPLDRPSSTIVTMGIIETCYSGLLDQVVVVSSEFRDFDIWHRYFPAELQMYTIGGTADTNFSRLSRVNNDVWSLNDTIGLEYYSGNLFLVHTGRRNVTVALALKLARKTVLWDARSVFVFINQKLRSGLACQKARQDLIDAWMHFEVYRMLYACFDAENRVQIYSLNPFSVEVTDPELWELVELIELANVVQGHKYRASFLKLIAPRVEKRHCEDLVMAVEGQKIDNGYPVLVSDALRDKLFELKDPKLNTSLVDSYTGLDLNIVKIAMKKMNVTTVVILSNVSGHFDKGQPRGSFQKLMENKHDMLVERKYRRNIGEFWRLQNTASDDRSMCVVTRKKSQVSEADNSVIAVELTHYTLISVIYLVTLLIFIVVLKTRPLQAMMEFCRLSGGHATLRVPTGILPRLIYISMVWMIFFVVTTWVSGNISATIVDSKNPNIDNIRDLVDSNYTIKGIPGFQEFFFDDRLARRFINITLVKQCYQELREGARLACIDDCELAPYNRSIHWLSKPIYQTLIANVVREDWPLLRSYEDLVQWMVEMGLIEREKILFFRAKRNHHFDDYVKDQLELNGRPLKLNSMRILFAIFLSRMLIIALTIFIAEILIDRYLQKKRQNEIIRVLLSLQRDMKKYQLQRRLQDVRAPK
ncbi:unnamed protein product [Trichogramma brassicae]|uniref:Ionotropic glutamate receptor C-terminal domain-containing protein n=1 Tax=Trichogramma brassicae TaxID=86971 RepID=A0A6H5I9V8_9HYME|nr:unnamed protein product [Trichogramma brassicae]